DDPFLFKFPGLAPGQADDDLVSLNRLDLDLSVRRQFDHIARPDLRLSLLMVSEEQVNEIQLGRAFGRMRMLGDRTPARVAMAALFYKCVVAEIFKEQLPSALGALRVKRHPFEFFTVTLPLARVLTRQPFHLLRIQVPFQKRITRAAMFFDKSHVLEQRK